MEYGMLQNVGRGIGGSQCQGGSKTALLSDSRLKNSEDGVAHYIKQHILIWLILGAIDNLIEYMFLNERRRSITNDSRVVFGLSLHFGLGFYILNHLFP